MKYEEVLKKWLADQRTYQKYSTYTCYANIVTNHLLPHLGQLEEVTTDIVQDLALRLLESGNRVTGGGLSQSFVRDILIDFINTFLVWLLCFRLQDGVQAPGTSGRKSHTYAVRLQQKTTAYGGRLLWAFEPPVFSVLMPY